MFSQFLDYEKDKREKIIIQLINWSQIMYLKSALIVCSALFSQYANGAESNYPEKKGGVFQIPSFPDMCSAIPGKKGKLAVRRGKAQSPYQWSDSAICGISQPGKFIWLLNFHEHYHQILCLNRIFSSSIWSSILVDSLSQVKSWIIGSHANKQLSLTFPSATAVCQETVGNWKERSMIAILTLL